MAKDAYYFSHDFGARNDPKLQKVLMKLGQEGKGVFWDLIEMLFEEGGMLMLSECESYAFALRTDEKCINSLINDFGLFNKDNIYFWSESVNKRLKQRSEKSEKARQSAMDRWNKDANASIENANALRIESDSNAIKEIKSNENKENDLFVGISSQPNNQSEIKLNDVDRCKRFVEYFNSVKKSKYQPTEKVKKLFKIAIKNYSTDDLIKVITNALADKHHIENNHLYVTPEFVLRTDIIERYKNINVKIKERSLVN